MCDSYLKNNRYTNRIHLNKEDILAEILCAYEFLKTLPGYSKTPIVRLRYKTALQAENLVYCKDEGNRFGETSFKPLGASYSIFCELRKYIRIKFPNVEYRREDLLKKKYSQLLSETCICAASDGNHGKAVSWFSKIIGVKCRIYLPQSTDVYSVEQIKKYGSEVVLLNGIYDDCVVKCHIDAQTNKWIVISDTAYKGNQEAPEKIIYGYALMFLEISEEFYSDLDFIFVQAGVGGLAAACALYLFCVRNIRTKLIVVEPARSDCIYQSLKAGRQASSSVLPDSKMAGLNCNKPSDIAWKILKNTIYGIVRIPEKYSDFAREVYRINRIKSGCSGSASLGGALYIQNEKSEILMKKKILVINTESNPSNFKNQGSCYA